MSWPSSGAIIVTILGFAAVLYVVRVEQRLAKGELPRVGYSFRGVWRFAGLSTVLSATIASVIYWASSDFSRAMEWFVIMLALGVAGTLRGLLAEHHHKRSGGRNLDSASKHK